MGEGKIDGHKFLHIGIHYYFVDDSELSFKDNKRRKRSFICTQIFTISDTLLAFYEDLSFYMVSFSFSLRNF